MIVKLRTLKSKITRSNTYTPIACGENKRSRLWLRYSGSSLCWVSHGDRSSWQVRFPLSPHSQEDSSEPPRFLRRGTSSSLPSCQSAFSWVSSWKLLPLLTVLSHTYPPSLLLPGSSVNLFLFHTTTQKCHFLPASKLALVIPLMLLNPDPLFKCTPTSLSF